MAGPLVRRPTSERADLELAPLNSHGANWCEFGKSNKIIGLAHPRGTAPKVRVLRTRTSKTGVTSPEFRGKCKFAVISGNWLLSFRTHAPAQVTVSVKATDEMKGAVVRSEVLPADTPSLNCYRRRLRQPAERAASRKVGLAAIKIKSCQRRPSLKIRLTQDVSRPL